MFCVMFELVFGNLFLKYASYQDLKADLVFSICLIPYAKWDPVAIFSHAIVCSFNESHSCI